MRCLRLLLRAVVSLWRDQPCLWCRHPARDHHLEDATDWCTRCDCDGYIA